jgi:hypothetical protein
MSTTAAPAASLNFTNVLYDARRGDCALLQAAPQSPVFLSEQWIPWLRGK